MASRRLHLSFPHGAPLWARWGRRVCIGNHHYRVGRASDGEAVLWLERPSNSEEPVTREATTGDE